MLLEQKRKKIVAKIGICSFTDINFISSLRLDMTKLDLRIFYL